jgi:hypothetical protein
VASLFAAFGLGTPAFCLCCFKTWWNKQKETTNNSVKGIVRF